MTTRRGTTLIELVVVIALMAIIAGVSAPALASLDRKTQTSGLDALVSLLTRSRATAVQRATVVTVTIDPATSRYWVDPPDTVALLNVSMSADAPRVHFRFTPDGQTVADEPLFVRDGQSTSAVLIEPWTGEVRRGR
jgi:prepilin-type N-terminal cleavage/methylation domain-containing protein